MFRRAVHRQLPQVKQNQTIPGKPVANDAMLVLLIKHVRLVLAVTTYTAADWAVLFVKHVLSHPWPGLPTEVRGQRTSFLWCLHPVACCYSMGPV